jgi:hypothetical protein
VTVEKEIQLLKVRIQFLESILLEFIDEVFPEEVLQDSLDAIKRIRRDLAQLRDVDDTY